jgi:hypothetical protein
LIPKGLKQALKDLEERKRNNPAAEDDWKPAPIVELFHQYRSMCGSEWEDFYYRTPIAVILQSCELYQYRIQNGVLSWVELAFAKGYQRGKLGKTFGRTEQFKQDNPSPMSREESDSRSVLYVPIYDESEVKIIEPKKS